MEIFITDSFTVLPSCMFYDAPLCPAPGKKCDWQAWGKKNEKNPAYYTFKWTVREKSMKKNPSLHWQLAAAAMNIC